MKGRLHCPKCHSRVGGFDFVSGQKCACGFCVLPAVHLIRSKVDQDVQACTVMQQHE
jgi:E3 ubiquitin-protein ligase RNF180